MRTGASAAVSAKWLARKDSKVLAILGTGSVGQGTLATCDAVFAWEDVRIWSRTQIRRPLPGERGSPSIRVSRSTGTTDVERGRRGRRRDRHRDARPHVARRRCLGEAGAHIAALGADLAGEQELDPRILQRGRVFVDDIRQCRDDGEINVALREGLITEADVAGEIGKVITGELEGRQTTTR